MVARWQWQREGVSLELDAKDRQLIALLQDNARQSTTELAKRLELSRTTVQARIERLERRGIISGYTITYGSAYASQLIEAHINITTRPKLSPRVETKIRGIPEVAALFSVSGTFDMIAIVRADSIEQIDKVIDAIGQLDGVERTVSSVVLSKKFQKS
jgi:DNA-binding Lrp family transcriptional regulator